MFEMSLVAASLRTRTDHRYHFSGLPERVLRRAGADGPNLSYRRDTETYCTCEIGLIGPVVVIVRFILDALPCDSLTYFSFQKLAPGISIGYPTGMDLYLVTKTSSPRDG